jgi:hypothetical protein
MARVEIKVRPGEGVRGYSLFVDGMPQTLGPGHSGEARCDGRCGDGSRHSLLYSFNGAPGSSLAIILRCAGREVCRLREALIVGSGGYRRAGRTTFEI